MENLQEDFKVSQENSKVTVQDTVATDDLLKQNNLMKIEISDLENRIKKLTVEKNRLVCFKYALSQVDISNSVRSHIRNWKEAQENRQDRTTQSMITKNINMIANNLLNSVDSKDSSNNNVSRNPKIVARQSDKETASQNKSRTKLTKPLNNVKYSGELPEKFQASMQNRALGVRNWNIIHD